MCQQVCFIEKKSFSLLTRIFKTTYYEYMIAGGPSSEQARPQPRPNLLQRGLGAVRASFQAVDRAGAVGMDAVGRGVTAANAAIDRGVQRAQETASNVRNAAADMGVVYDRDSGRLIAARDSLAFTVATRDAGEELTSEQRVQQREARVASHIERAREAHNPAQAALDTLTDMQMTFTTGDRLRTMGSLLGAQDAARQQVAEAQKNAAANPDALAVAQQALKEATSAVDRGQEIARGEAQRRALRDFRDIMQGLGYSQRRINAIMGEAGGEANFVQKNLDIFVRPAHWTGERVYRTVMVMQEELGRIEDMAMTEVAATKVTRTGRVATHVDVAAAAASAAAGFARGESGQMMPGLEAAIAGIAQEQKAGAESAVANAVDTYYGMVNGVLGVGDRLMTGARNLGSRLPWREQPAPQGAPTPDAEQTRTKAQQEARATVSAGAGGAVGTMVEGILGFVVGADQMQATAVDRARGLAATGIGGVLRMRRMVNRLVEVMDSIDPTAEGKLRKLLNATMTRVTGRKGDALSFIKGAGDQLLASMWTVPETRDAVYDELLSEAIMTENQRGAGRRALRWAARPIVAVASSVGHRLLGVAREPSATAQARAEERAKQRALARTKRTGLSLIDITEPAVTPVAAPATATP